MATRPGDDLACMARLLGLRVPPPELEQEATHIRTLLADQEKLRALPLDDREPAFIPWLPLDPSAGA
jgi:hypothetical protein